MLFTFRQSENAEGCIMWGKVLRSLDRSAVSPVKVTRFESGSETASFLMNYHSEKIGGNWQFEHATVGVHADASDSVAMKHIAMVQNLRASDPVLVIGRHTSKTKKGPRSGKTVTEHYVEAFAVIPAAWLYDIFNELFEDIVATSAAPSTKKRQFTKSKFTPEVIEEAEEAPAETEDSLGGWFD